MNVGLKIAKHPAAAYYRPSDTFGYAHLMPGGLLAQGSAPPSGSHVPFDVIVLSAFEYQDADLPGYEVVRVPLSDPHPPNPPPDSQTRARIRATAREIAGKIRRGERVLVTCRQGRNRSGLLAGLALVELGMSPSQAIHRIQMHRRNALTNPYFQRMIRGML